jgi:hypothetical protein
MNARGRTTIGLAAAVACALTAAQASAQADAQHEPHGVPLTPPPLVSPSPGDERTPAAQPSSGSAGLALMVVLVGPLGFVLGGATAASTPGNVAVPFIPTPRWHPLAPAVEQRPTGGAE